MINNYKLFVWFCDIENLDINYSFNFLKVYKNIFVDLVLLVDCIFKNIFGYIFNMDKEFDDIGIYNVENVIVENCSFQDVGGSVVKFYCGGCDESIFGLMVWISDLDFIDVGYDQWNKNEFVIYLYGI